MAEDYQSLAQKLIGPLWPWIAARLDLWRRGTAFPASPAAGDRYFRTDLGLDCEYDGTRWLTVHEYTMSLAQQTISANTTLIVAPLRGGYAPYITRVSTEYNVATTNNSGNKWTIVYRGVNASYGAASQIHAYNSDAPGAGVWALDDSAPNTSATPANYAFIDFGVSKTGAPGTLQISGTLTYRLIVP